MQGPSPGPRFLVILRDTPPSLPWRARGVGFASADQVRRAALKYSTLQGSTTNTHAQTHAQVAATVAPSAGCAGAPGGPSPPPRRARPVSASGSGGPRPGRPHGCLPALPRRRHRYPLQVSRQSMTYLPERGWHLIGGGGELCGLTLLSPVSSDPCPHWPTSSSGPCCGR